MEDEGWTFGEKEDILAMGIPPIAPVDAEKGVGGRHPGRSKAGKQHEKEIAKEQANLKRDYRERLASEKNLVAARRGQQKCQPCKNRSRACDRERPVCGTCKELNIGAKCIYLSALDHDNVTPPSPQPRTPEDPTSPDSSMVDAPIPAVSTDHARSHRTALHQMTPLLRSDQSGVEGYNERSQPKKRGRRRKRDLPDMKGNDNNDGAKNHDKRRRLG